MRTSVVLLLSVFFVGCASSTIRSDYDRDADFSRYSTYNFYKDAGPEDTNYQSLFSKYMVEAISLEMDKRGYTKSDEPDLLVNFNAVLQEKTQVRTTSAPRSSVYYGYRRGYYSSWPSYHYATETHVSQYTEGTFNIDLVDARKQQLVWEAVGTGRVTQKKLENLEQEVKEGVPQFFASFPFRAGEGTPAVPQD
jgi:hypothetical protein